MKHKLSTIGLKLLLMLSITTLFLLNPALTILICLFVLVVLIIFMGWFEEEEI